LIIKTELVFYLGIRLSGVAEQVYTRLYGKSQFIQQKVVAKEKIIPEKTSKFEEEFA
jgi:hypothetical protein